MGKSSLAMTLMFFDYQSITFRFTINVRQFGDQLCPICAVVGQLRYKETKLDKRAFSNDGLQSINSGARTRIHAAPSSWQLFFCNIFESCYIYAVS